MDHRLHPTHESARRSEVPGLEHAAALQFDARAEAVPVAEGSLETKHHAMPPGSPVPIDTRRLPEMIDHQVQVTVPVQIAQRGTEADSLVIQAPFC